MTEPKKNDHDLLIEIHTIVTDLKKQACSDVGFTRCAKRGEQIKSLEGSRTYQKYFISGLCVAVIASLIISILRFLPF